MSQEIIFLVDDNLTNLIMGQNALEDHYDVLTLNSGERLLKVLEKKKPSLILLDVEMPGISGYDAIKIIKANPDTADIPVIFLTAKTDIDNELDGLSLGAVDYITKPFSPLRLIKHIEVHLLIQSQKRELVAQKQELINFSENLQEMVTAKTRSVLELQSVLLKSMAELVDCRDDITGGHIERTTNYLRILLNALIENNLHKEAMASWNMELLLQSAQLHDVGKIAVSDSILMKPDKLTAEEFEEIKKHTVYGEKVIEKIKKNTTEHLFLEHAKIFAATHHEKWDGSGYPRGLRGEEIPLQGRLMAIVDVYDALISDRPYKKGFPHETTVKIIVEGRGAHFDPELVDVFVGVAEEFNRVRLEAGEACKAEPVPAV
ncbi:MAG: response regulator [Chitinispirillales bacterium]|jgi:putative two-component system response regulator|nr:response regulator [Chitinispirillales bacterium]